ncbi:MAG: hypothetical protein JSV88_03350 [Candidatus Aminicenantes bacterium]|nr:MAG: hypothetical protein JSV88_03350 [Candidatus Aminicenantes bacterium]
MVKVESTMKKQLFLKTIGNWLVILIVILLSYKFFMWNYWKVERAAALTKKILKAPPAVNLVLSKDHTPVFQKSFAYNPRGNYYIVNQWDITPYIADDDNNGTNHDSKFTLEVSVNNQIAESLSVHRFKTFNIITYRDHYFVFTTPDCSIEEFVKLKDSIPSIINFLVEKGKNGQTGNH